MPGGVRMRGAEVKLYPKEYDIRRALVAHAGKVPTRRRLLDEVGGGETDAQYLRVYKTRGEVIARLFRRNAKLQFVFVSWSSFFNWFQAFCCASMPRR